MPRSTSCNPAIRLAGTVERITYHGVDEIEHAMRNLAVGLAPEAIFAKFGVEKRLPACVLWAPIASRRKLGHAAGSCSSAPGAAERRQQTSRIPWRSQKVSGPDEPGQLGGRKEGSVARSLAADDDRFLLVHNLIENGDEICPKAGVGGLGSASVWLTHYLVLAAIDPVHICTGSCTPSRAGRFACNPDFPLDHHIRVGYASQAGGNDRCSPIVEVRTASLARLRWSTACRRSWAPSASTWI
jgi:hypothetical protein